MTYKKLKDILKNKKRKVVSTEESLKDVTPMEWSEEVIKGNKKVNVTENLKK